MILSSHHRRSRAGPPGGLGSIALAALLIAIQLVWAGSPAHALQPITLDNAVERVDIAPFGSSPNGQLYDGRGDNLQVEIAAGADGAGGRMSVGATTPGTNPNWIVFALRNSSDKQVERLLVAERFTLVGSGVVWPDLDARRIEAVTASAGYRPERVPSDRADIFRLTLEPGQTITFVVELSSDRYAHLSLWQSFELETRLRNRQLFNGVMLGVTGLLALFLTAVFAANHAAIFPAAALVTWSVLALLCVDFGFWHKLFQVRPEDNAHYRAAAEAAIAASLVIFIYAFLRLKLLNAFLRLLFLVWIAGQLALVATAALDPRLAATVARMSYVLIGGIGALLILYLAMRGQDRALTLVPSWLLLLVWLFAASVALTGRLGGEGIVFGLIAGLVLLVVLMGFTVTQFAFRSQEPMHGVGTGQLQSRALAIDGSGSAVWEWTARRDEIKVDPVIESALGLTPGDLSGKVPDFIRYMHPADKERFELALQGVRERTSSVLKVDFRMRHSDSSYRWLELEATAAAVSDRRAVRCIGLVRDVTAEKLSHERLLHDAVHDGITGLPNRELFLDRLGVALARARSETNLRPVVVFVDLDKFKSVNSSFGFIAGDTLLLMIARRLQRHLTPQDTLARVGGDQFALLMLSEQDPRELAILTERFRRTMKAPIKIAGQDIVITASIGVAIYDGRQAGHLDLMREAETAMYRAKRHGTDRIEIFAPDQKADRDDRVAIESELRRAIENNELTILYQPIMLLSNEEVAGFEALVRWEHPRLGLLNPAEFVPVAEESDLIVKLGSVVLAQAMADMSRWQRELPRPEDPLFLSVNVSSRQLMTQELIQQVRHQFPRSNLAKGTLRLEITESLVMQNPEQATVMLDLLKSAGVGLSLDDFGVGYSSLAYLQRFPFDSLKIDRSLVQAATTDPNGAVIVRSIVALAHELGKKVIAEGVEAAEDAKLLRSIGCEYAQGYYYDAPLSAKNVSHLLKLIRKSDRNMSRRGLVRGREKKREAGEGEATPPPAEAAAHPPFRNGAARPAAPDAADGPAGPQMMPGARPVSTPDWGPPPLAGAAPFAAPAAGGPTMAPAPGMGGPMGGAGQPMMPPPLFRSVAPPPGAMMAHEAPPPYDAPVDGLPPQPSPVAFGEPAPPPPARAAAPSIEEATVLAAAAASEILSTRDAGPQGLAAPPHAAGSGAPVPASAQQAPPRQASPRPPGIAGDRPRAQQPSVGISPHRLAAMSPGMAASLARLAGKPAAPGPPSGPDGAGAAPGDGAAPPPNPK